jgi:23S rRNA (cytosine1962-C5)-methyltransferase
LPTARARSAASRARLRVSAASARILRAGHPWVLRDRDTGDLSLLAPGVTADLVAPDGSFVARAMIDPGRPLCARVLAWEPDEPLDQAAMTRRAAAALERRASLLGDPETDAIRLIHGEADGLPGLFVDRWADLLVATRASVAVAAWSSGVYDLLRGRFPGAALWERDHFDDLQARDPGPDAARLPGRWAFGGITPSGSGPREVHERGLRFLVDPLHGLSSGLYPDQRENRDRLAALLRASPGGAVANLFAHTGAFSVACAAAGADCVLSVDLSPRFCDQAQDNLRRNGLDPERHPVLVADAAAWLREDKRPLRGLIVDPPAHARARSGRRGGWSTKDDLVPLLATAFGRLEPGGFLLCCVNWKGLKKGAIEDSVRAAARSAGRRLSSLLAAPPAADFPRLRGFPEGTAFWGVLATVGAPA